MEPVRWLDADEQLAWRLYLDTSRLFTRTLDRQLMADAGISLTDYEILVHLSEAPDRRLRMSDLADVLTTTRSGITRAVSRLVDAGWVRRAECLEDKRGMLAELTDEGSAKLAESSPGHVEAVRRTMFDPLGTQGVASMTRIFQQLHAQPFDGDAKD